MKRSADRKENVNYSDSKKDLGNVPDYKDFVTLLGDLFEKVNKCLKKGGYIVVDYLSDIHGYIQHVLLSKDFLFQKDSKDFYNNLEIDEIFSYDNKNKIERIMNELGVKQTKFYSTDSITRFIKEDINKLNEIELNKWISFINNISSNENIIDLSEHCLAIGIKN